VAAPQPVQPVPITSAPPSSVTEYKVVEGDILGRIALRYNTTVKSLKELNQLQSSLIFPGQVLKVAAPQPVQPVQPVPITSVSPSNVTEHKVVEGDILGRIALRYNTTVKSLKELNQLQSSLIFPGQVLKVAAPQPVQPVQPVQPAQPIQPAQPAQPVQPTQPPQQAQPVEPPSFNISNLLDIAKSKIGIPYLWGGTTPSGFDCSGFVYYVYNQAGKHISRQTADGYYNRSYYVSQPQPGDLLFFENTYKQGISHIGIYIGNNSFIHSDNDGVRITSVNDRYYSKHLDGYKRLF
jgi:cell wall-associated NlpC family hydrolase